MMRTIDYVLDRVTMYRLVLYELIFLLAAAVVVGALGFIPYSPAEIVYSAGLIFIIAWVTNKVFAYFYDAPSNPESTYLTALILGLIVTPAAGLFDTNFLIFAIPAALLAVGSKYIVAIRKKHIFNPAAFGVAISALLFGGGASWWVGTPVMLPFVMVGGLLIVRKLRRFDLFIGFLAAFIVALFVFNVSSLPVFMSSKLLRSFLYAPAFFLGTVMLTEPLTMPGAKWMRVAFGALVGILIVPQVHFGGWYPTPEWALLIGNLFAYLTGSKQKLLLTLKEKIRLTPSTYEFVFTTPHRLSFKAGQYLEWTLAHTDPDARGIRRYFTIASAPADKDIKLGVKFYEPASTFKQKLLSLKSGDSMVATQLGGDFTLPRDSREKLVFISGGIGITPFRSIVSELLARKEKRDIVHFYTNRTSEDIAYKNLLDRAERELGIRTVYVCTDKNAEGNGPRAISRELIAREVPDYRERTFYLSGPQAMVAAFDTLLRSLRLSSRQIKKDYFPGFA